MYTSQFLAFGLLVAAPLASAHGLISSVTGDLGGKGIGLGVTEAGIQNEGDVTVFKTGVFGATGAGGPVNLATGLAAQLKATGKTLPQVSTAKGVITMTFHQLNADGAGPISCSVSEDASGKNFKAMKVTTNVPGNNGRSNAANANFPLVADLPAGTKCTGTVGAEKGVCAVKCANPVGPFGSMVLVQQAKGKKRGLGGSLAARAKAALSL